MFFWKKEKSVNMVIKKEAKVPLRSNKEDWVEFHLPSDPILCHGFMMIFKDVANIIMSNRKKWLQVDVSSSLMTINSSYEFFEKIAEYTTFHINGRDYVFSTLDTNNPEYFFACYKAVAEWFKSYEILENFKYYIKPLSKQDIMNMYEYMANIIKGQANLDEAFRAFLEDRARGKI